MTEALKRCPFCGGEASKNHASGRFERVYCKDCFAQTGGLHSDRAMAKKAWNTRADLVDPKAIREAALVEALTVIDALDPDGLIDGCSQNALRGLVLRMGQIARTAIAAWEKKK